MEEELLSLAECQARVLGKLRSSRDDLKSVADVVVPYQSLLLELLKGTPEFQQAPPGTALVKVACDVLGRLLATPAAASENKETEPCL